MDGVLNFEEIFNDSYARVQNHEKGSEEFFREFYTHFISSDEEVREKLGKTDMKTQRKMLKDSLYRMLNFSVSKNASQFMKDIALRHGAKDLDIRRYLYDIWLTSLLHTVEKFDPKYDRDVGLAWKIVMSNGIAYMTDLYDR